MGERGGDDMSKGKQKGQCVWSVLSKGGREVELRSEKCLAVGDGCWKSAEEDRWLTAVGRSPKNFVDHAEYLRFYS